MKNQKLQIAFGLILYIVAIALEVGGLYLMETPPLPMRRAPFIVGISCMLLCAPLFIAGTFLLILPHKRV